ncbi:metallophosphoesterase [Actinophytocola gossypii]|uniref:Metallophosphoesterase n=1 Tax=Actinophytocola gossypii TaxID=2812003 RepID=A0ABT2J1W1_9PSEU|nr:metallophosphoesterase [Actinophytocola gossypii]MCT2581834.1 metallophosphoesterase [Actinophytocola gossypii]
MPTRSDRLVRPLVTVLAVLGLIVVGVTPTASAAELELDGSGSNRDPYRIATRDDLLAAATAINEDPGSYASASYVLTADIDFGGAEFPGINTLTGTLDGAGHTISDIVYGTHPDDGQTNRNTRALVRDLTDGTIRDLVVERPVADNGDDAGFVSGLVVYGVNATITGTSVLDADLTAAGAEKAGGLLAELNGGTVTDNRVTGDITANEMPGGLAAYAKGDTLFANNLVAVDLTMRTGGGADGTKGNNAGFVVAYPGTPNSGTFTGNVALSGSITGEGRVDGFLGRIVGYTAYGGWTAENNLANAAITVGGATVTGPGVRNQHGTDVTAAKLAQQATYEALGFDFRNEWQWDDTLGHPVPSDAYSLFGAGTPEVPYELGSEADLEFLATELNTGNPKYTGDRSYRLTTDLDFTGREPFGGIDLFEGELDGAGHTITGLSYAPSTAGAEHADRLGLIRTANGAAIRDLTLAGVTADAGEGTGFVAAVAVVLRDSTVEGVSVVDARLTARAAEKVAGITAEAHGASTIRNNWVDGSMSADKMPAGVVAYATGTTEVTENLVAAELSVDQPGGVRGVNAALVVAYPGNGNEIVVERNVAFAGGIAYEGETANFAGRILGYVGGDPYRVASLADNLALDTIRVGGATVTGRADDQNGADTTAAALGEQATYEGVDWDFGSDWTFDAALGHPVPKFVTDDQAPNRIATTFHGDSKTRRGFSWYSSVDGDAVVRVSADREFPDGETLEFPAEASRSRSGEQLLKAVATGLDPETRYYYRLGSPDAQIWSPTGTFQTSDGEDDFTFVDLTDTQSQNEDEAGLSAATMAKSLEYVPGAEFILHGGDLVERGGVEQDWVDIMTAAEETLLSTTFAPTAGNHDEAQDAFVDHFSLATPNRQDTAHGAYYSFDYNDAHFAVLNTNEDPDQAVSDAQLDWLRTDVRQARKNGADWIILSMHKGAYTTATHLDDREIIAMRDVLVPLVDELDIDLVLQGHDHVISRTKALVSDPNGVEGARPAETEVITEIVNGKRIEYSVDPDGTIFFLPNTAGAKHYRQATEVGGGIDLEAYLNLFERTGERATENFAAVSVTDGRLTVDLYDIRDEGSPRVFESFGIDRQISPVVARIDALPSVEQVTRGDAERVARARADVDSLTEAQRTAVSNLAKLTALEHRLRELGGLVTTDGSAIAWADAEAEFRQPITVNNDTRGDLTDTPVRVTLDATPDVAADQLTVAGENGAPLSHEVETWRPGGTSVLWVKLPALPARSATTVWAYFGGGDDTNDPADVWSDGYALVEHLDTASEGGDRVPDSTGRHTGTVIGGRLETTTTGAGTTGSVFGDARIQYPGDVGGDHDRFTVSTLYSLTEDQLAALTGNSPMVAKENADGTGRTTFWQGVVPETKQLGNRLAGNSFEFSPFDVGPRAELPAPGKQHLVTQTYDGMTYSVFVDGQEVHSQFLEYRTTYSDPDVPTTIGDYATADGSLAAPFSGSIDEVQISGKAFTPDFEKFRYDNLFGDAVRVGALADRAEDPVSLVIGTPTAGTELDAGLVPVTGTVSERSTLVATVAGEEVFGTSVAAGAFSVEVPVNALGERTVAFTATAEDGGTASAETRLTVTDTSAPAQPELSDDADSAAGGDVTLTATPRTGDREVVDATFHAHELLTLDESNTVVRTGSTTDRTPEALTPTSGETTGDLSPTTVGDDENPFQIYAVSLTGRQAEAKSFHVTWRGTGDTRTVSAWVYDHGAGRWLLKDSGSNAEGGEVTLDVTARADEHAVEQRRMHILVWRGLTEMPTGDDHDFTALPDAGDYDWAFDHVPDTQLYAQATPELMVDQFEYVADVAKKRKTEIVVQAGDLVNRPYLSQEYQFANAEPAVRAWEDAEIPYLISWGNHDYDDARNNRVLLPEYYPMERLAASLDGSPFTFGGSHDIDNYFYEGEVHGAKLLFLTVGYFSIDNGDEPAIAWAKDVIESHPDSTVILAIHNSVNLGANNWSNPHVLDQLVKPYGNVVLTLGGHVTGTGVAATENAPGGTSYGVLTDYQGRVYGGQEFLKHVSVDAENGLMYFNTYSPLLDATSSDGPWHHDLAPGAVPGLHGHDTENYVLELDLGGRTTRTLTTSSFTVAAGTPTQVGDTRRTTGDDPVSVTMTRVSPGVAYEWYVVLEDAAGNVTRSAPKVFSVEVPAVPGAPTDVVGRVDGQTVTVTWSAPETGGRVERYEVVLRDSAGRRAASTTVGPDRLSAVFEDVRPRRYRAFVRAEGGGEWSEWSEPSAPFVVTGRPGPGRPGAPGNRGGG